MGEECNLWTLAQSGFVTSGHPIQNVCLLCCFVSLLTFFVSSITFNYSQVDKIWSIVPFLYAWMLIADSRTVLMAILTTIWGLRLTYNFARRGGYQWPPWCGDEDYRWAYIQRGEFIKPLANPIVYAIFNFTFISVYQNVLLLLIASPSIVTYTVATGCTNTAKTTGKLNILDYIATFLILSSITIETIADNQQYAFQTEKYRRREEKKREEHMSSTSDEYSDGFCQSGLFSIVRKPNYAAEQFIWIFYYFFYFKDLGRLRSNLRCQNIRSTVVTCKRYP